MRSTKVNPTLLIGLLLAGILVAGCSEGGYRELNGATMGTYYRVAYRAGGSCEFAEDTVEPVLLQVNRVMSTYMDDSELSLLNSAPAQRWIPVSPMLMQVIDNARLHFEHSAGAFDVTVGPLVNIWGFGAAAAPEPPSEAAQQAAAARVGMDKVQLRAGALRKQHEGIYIDLSALAKGFAVDKVADLLIAAGCSDFMVDIGGEMRVAGASPRGDLWRIGIEMPDAAQFGVSQAVVALSDTALATSGDYRNYRLVDGRRVAHVLDPRSGLPARNHVVSATVLHPRAMWADAYATTVMVLGEEAGLAYADREGFAVYILSRSAYGDAEPWRARYNDAMQPYLAEPNR